MPSGSKAQPGRATCSMKALSSAGMSPIHSGKNQTRCWAQTMSCCTGASAAGTGPVFQSCTERRTGKSSAATLIARTSWPAASAPSA